jgi:L-2-hydroxyglutarate oxidase LhgO
MSDKMKVPLMNPDGSMRQEIGTVMTVTDAKEPWAEYALEDGTKIRLRQSVVSIVKLDGQADANGNPVYAVQSQQQMSVIPRI